MDKEQRLQNIYNLTSDYLASGRDLLVSTRDLLLEILKISETSEEPIPNKKSRKKKNKENKDMAAIQPVTEEIIISCDASIKENPGGPCSVGIVIRFPEEAKRDTITLSKCVPSKTNNEAEYDAVYEGISTLFNMVNSPNYPVVIHSDSQLVVKQLLGKYKIRSEILEKKCKSIHELCSQLPVPIRIEWHPRNSTPDLTEANFKAQDILNVRRH